MFLTDKELLEMTGRKTHPAQMRWLDENGFRYVISRLGDPKVSRAHVEIKMGGRLPDRDDAHETEPDFIALQERG